MIINQFTQCKLTLIISLTLAVGISGCGGGEGTNLDSNGNPVDDTTPSTPLAPTLASIQENIFTPSCGASGCHAPGTAPFGLRLDDAALSAQLLVNVSSFEVPSLMRVNPSDPDNSFLINKIEGTQSAGDRMPLNRTPLTPEQIQVVRDWISAGAETNSISSLATTSLPGADFATIQETVFTPICTSCHSGEAPSAELSLEENISYHQLVNKTRFPDDPYYPVRVIPGDAENSFLIKKLEGRLKSDEGMNMPLNHDPLPIETIQLIRTWIDNGATAPSTKTVLEDQHVDTL